MTDSDNAQVQIDTPPEEEKESAQEAPTEEAAAEVVIPTVNTKATRKPKEPKEPTKKSNEIVSSLETAENFDDQKPLTPEPSLIKKVMIQHLLS